MLAYQQAFREWHESTVAAVAEYAAGGKADAEAMERSFQSCLDATSLEQIGRKLIGPASTPMMTPKVKELDRTMKEKECDLKRILSCPESTHEDRAGAVRSYRRAKAAALKAVEERREEMELQIFEQIESTQSDSKLFWSHVSCTLRSFFSPRKHCL